MTRSHRDPAPGTPPAASSSGGALQAASRRGTLAPPAWEEVDTILVRSLAEDRGTGDVTSETAVPELARARARLLAKEPGVLAGLEVFARVFRLCDREARIELHARDGEDFDAGRELATIEGRARALLLAERTALNLLQRMSGI